MGASAAAPPRSRDVGALTGLRGVAALWVMVFHFGMFADPSVPWIGSVFVRQGYLAVDVFFALSGYILTLSYGHLFRGRFTLNSYGSYLWRRIARIYPVYILATLLTFGLGLGLNLYPQGEIIPLLVTNALLIQNWGLTEPINGPAWSLSVEFAAYILLPLLLRVLWTSPARVAIMAGLACVAATFWLATLHPTIAGQVKHGLLDNSWGHSFGPVVRCLADFSLGILAFRTSDTPLFAPILRSRIACLAVPVVMLAAAAWPGGDIVVVLLAPVLVACLPTNRGVVGAVLGSTVCVWLGEVSYSLYLFHMHLLRIGIWTSHALTDRLGGTTATFVGLAVATVVILLVSWASYRLIEQPMRSYLAGLGKRPARWAIARSEMQGAQDLAGLQQR